MNRLPFGQTFSLCWHFTNPDGTAFDISSRTPRLIYTNSRGEEEASSLTIGQDGSYLTWVFSSQNQVFSGDYSIKVILSVTGQSPIVITYAKAFSLVKNIELSCNNELQNGGSIENTTAINLYSVVDVISMGGYSNYSNLSNKPQINGVTLLGNKTSEQLGIHVPVNVSELQNDSGYVTNTYHDSTKVDKENGKGLSSNDFTSTEKAKLAGLNNYDDTSIKSRVSAIEGKEAAWDGKQEKIQDLDRIRVGAALGANAIQPVPGKGLSSNDFTTPEKTKLAGLYNYDDRSITSRVSTIEGKEPGWDSKQDQLVAGTGITIGPDGRTISCNAGGLPSWVGKNGKYLKSDGTNISWENETFSSATSASGATSSSTPIEQLKKNGSDIYPVTSPSAVRDSSGNDLNALLLTKVDKVTGKGLSTNDYDNIDKARVAEIPTINSKLGNCTTSNVAADKAFVNSSIATNTATFRGTYDLTKTGATDYVYFTSEEGIRVPVKTPICGQLGAYYHYNHPTEGEKSGQLYASTPNYGSLQIYIGEYLIDTLSEGQTKTITLSYDSSNSITLRASYLEGDDEHYFGHFYVTSQDAAKIDTTIQDDFGYDSTYPAILTCISWNVTGSPIADNNDYTFIVRTIGSNTAYSRNKYSVGVGIPHWEYEYTLNNSSFTQAQWAAINSGATAANIASIPGKQEKLIAGTNITIAADGKTISASGVTSYDQLTERPQINGVTLTGNKTAANLNLDNFVVTITEGSTEGTYVADKTFAQIEAAIAAKRNVVAFSEDLSSCYAPLYQHMTGEGMNFSLPAPTALGCLFYVISIVPAETTGDPDTILVDSVFKNWDDFIEAPSSGTTGQVLKKGADGAVWANESVTDVQVNGTTVISGGVANIPLASSSTFGAIKPGDGFWIGSGAYAGHIFLSSASSQHLYYKSDDKHAITPCVLDVAIKEGLGNYNLGTGGEKAWSSAYQAHAREVIGASAPIAIQILESGD